MTHAPLQTVAKTRDRPRRQRQVSSLKHAWWLPSSHRLTQRGTLQSHAPPPRSGSNQSYLHICSPVPVPDGVSQGAEQLRVASAPAAPQGHRPQVLKRVGGTPQRRAGGPQSLC